MATPPKKPSKPLYAKGTAPEMGVPPVIKRGNRGPIPTVHTVEYGSYPEDMKPGDIVHHSNSVNLSAASRKEKVASHVARRLQVGDDVMSAVRSGILRDRELVSLQASSHYSNLASKKREYGDAAREEYVTTGKKGGPVSIMARRNIKKINKNQNNILKAITPVNAGSSSTFAKVVNMEKSLPSTPSRKNRSEKLLEASVHMDELDSHEILHNRQVIEKINTPFTKSVAPNSMPWMGTLESHLNAGTATAQRILKNITKAINDSLSDDAFGIKPTRRGGGAGGPPRRRKM